MNVGSLEIQLLANIARLQSDMNKATGVVGRAMSSIDKSVMVATRAFGALGAALSLGQVIKMADQYTKLNAQLRLATGTQEEYNQAFQNVTSISKTAQANIGAIATTYARLSNALKDVGASQQQVSTLTETLALGLKVNGATAQETSSAMLQLSQAFGKGKLDGDEFRTAMEAAPNVMRALAQSMGVPFGALKDLAAQGQITADVMLKAFSNPEYLAALREQAKETRTVGGAWEVFTDSLTLAIGKINEATSASKILITVLEQAGRIITAISNGGEEGSLFKNFFGAGQKAIDQRASQMSTGELKEAAKWYGWAKEALKARQSKSTFGNELARTAEQYNGLLSPNFTSTIEAQDIEEIHKKQEEAAKKNKEIQDKYQEAITKKKLGEQTLYWEREGRLMEEKLDRIIKEDKLKAKLEKEDAERKEKYMAMLQKQANENFNEAQKQAKELEEEALKISENVSRSLTDALLRGFERGESFAQNFINRLKDMFRTLVLQPAIEFIINSSGLSKILGAVSTAFSGSALAGEGGSFVSSLQNGFGSIVDIFKSGNSSIVSSIQDLGTFLSTGNGGLGDTIGGFLGQYSSQIADGFGYFGAALQLAQGNIGGALGAGIGTFFGGPIGGAIGSFLGGALGGLFGGGLPPRVTESRGATSSGGVTSFYNGTDPGKRKLGAASSLDALNQTFLNNINTLFGAFDINSTIDVNSLLTKKKNTRSRFGANLDGQFLGFDDVSFGKKGTIQEAFASLVERALGSYTVRAIQASSLPDGIKKFFDGLTKKEDVADTINTLISMKKALVDLPPIFNAVRNAIDTTAYTTTLEQLKAQFQATQTFVDLFYSDTEKFDVFTQQLVTQLASLNQTLPTSREQYRALVESINVVDEATRDQFNGLIALAPAMNEYFNLLQQQRDEIESLNGALRGSEYFSTLTDFQRYQGVARNFGGVAANDTLIRDNSLMIGELKALRTEIIALRQANESTATSSKKTADLLTQVTEDGNALLTVAA